MRMGMGMGLVLFMWVFEMECVCREGREGEEGKEGKEAEEGKEGEEEAISEARLLKEGFIVGGWGEWPVYVQWIRGTHEKGTGY
ncbi:uncharacterized protein RAG0_03889 [Rhynchosporium agropyri]|uniref:Secreted protein n=1 Tax=Rhynchosporium agropyri TaxID=914238 RepID=A0A1E1K6L4_9HELO|nr:uncharacterized protein RAG0_03889 [Rhynchosporium agropyri]